MKKSLLIAAAFLAMFAAHAGAQMQAETTGQISASGGLIADAKAKTMFHVLDMQHFEIRRCSDGIWESSPVPEIQQQINQKRADGHPFDCWTVDQWDSPNTNTTEGLNDLLNKYWKGSGYTATWYCGLVDNASFGTYAAADTASKINVTANPPTTNDWQEADDYSGNRATLTLGTPSSGSVDNSASKCIFSITGTVTIRGAFLVTTNTVGGTTGVLFGASDFSVARSVLSGDTLNVTITLTAS